MTCRRSGSWSLTTRSGGTRRAWPVKASRTCVSGRPRRFPRVTWLSSPRPAAAPPSLSPPGGSGPSWLAGTGPRSCCSSTTLHPSSARAWRPLIWSASAPMAARTGRACGRPRRTTPGTPRWSYGWPCTGTGSSASPRAGSTDARTRMTYRRTLVPGAWAGFRISSSIRAVRWGAGTQAPFAVSIIPRQGLCGGDMASLRGGELRAVIAACAASSSSSGGCSVRVPSGARIHA
jgi:hypothetical protein